jgi:membrane associated rhomboid family serine protease
VTGWARPALIFVVFTLSVQLLPGLSDLLRFSRPAFEAGAWWQPLTSQWVHLSMLHAVVNAAAMALMLLAFDQLAEWRAQVISLLGGYLGAAAVIAMDPACISYAGASGALHGLLAGNALSVLVGHASRATTTSAAKDTLIMRHAAPRALALVALLILGIKLWSQHSAAANVPVGWLGFVSYYPAHEAGSLGGFILAAMLSALHRDSFAKRHASQRKNTQGQ